MNYISIPSPFFTCCFFINSPLIHVLFERTTYQKTGEKKIKWMRIYQSIDTHKRHLHRTRKSFFHEIKRSLVSINNNITRNNTISFFLGTQGKVQGKEYLCSHITLHFTFYLFQPATLKNFYIPLTQNKEWK